MYLLQKKSQERPSLSKVAVRVETRSPAASKATSYLMQKYGFSQDKAKKLVGCVGGRLAYLQNLWNLKHEILNDDDICGMVTKTLFPIGMDAERCCIVTRKPESTMILHEIINKGSMSLCDLKNGDWKRLKKI